MKKIGTLILIIILMVTTTSCTKKQQMYKASFLELFDTITEVASYADSKDDFHKFAQLIYDNLQQYHRLYDIYNEYDGIKNIKTINDNAGVKPVKVDQKIIDLLLFSKQMYQLTDGKVNVAMGAVLEIWHSYREEGINDPLHAKLPPMKELKEAYQHTNINDVIIDKANSTVFLKDKKMRLDVGAIAKGYSTEQVAQILNSKGYDDFLLSVGGNVRAVGFKSKKKLPWHVGIQNPDLNSKQKSICTLNINDLSIVSSGSYERYYTVKSKEYNHIINPNTLMPAQYYSQVSIVCKDSGLADALSTALFILPHDEGKTLIEHIDGASAMWVYADGSKKYSSHFKEYIKE